MVSFSAPTLAQRHSPSWKSIPCTLLLLQPHALSTNNPGKHPVLRPFPAPCCGPLAPRGSPRAVSRSGQRPGTVPLPPCATRSEGRGRCPAGTERTQLRAGTSSAQTAPQPEGAAGPSSPPLSARKRVRGPRGAGPRPAELPYLGARNRRSDRYRSRPPSAAPAAAPCCGRGPSSPVHGAESAGGSASPGNEEPERPRRPGHPVPSRAPGPGGRCRAASYRRFGGCGPPGPARAPRAPAHRPRPVPVPRPRQLSRNESKVPALKVHYQGACVQEGSSAQLQVCLNPISLKKIYKACWITEQQSCLRHRPQHRYRRGR